MPNYNKKRQIAQKRPNKKLSRIPYIKAEQLEEKARYWMRRFEHDEHALQMEMMLNDMGSSMIPSEVRHYLIEKLYDAVKDDLPPLDYDLSVRYINEQKKQ